jgi:hypothetical protein
MLVILTNQERFVNDFFDPNSREVKEKQRSHRTETRPMLEWIRWSCANLAVRFGVSFRLLPQMRASQRHHPVHVQPLGFP